MIGIVYIIFFYLYWRISKWAVNNTITWAAHTGRSYKLWGLIAAFVMYNLVFWDLIPTYATHQYYCMKEAGFTQYKSIDEWKNENADVYKELIPDKEASLDVDGNRYRYYLNQRIVWDIYTNKRAFNILEIEERIFDIKTKEILSKYKDFDMDIKSFGLGQRNLRDYKIWLKKDSCSDSKVEYEQQQFIKYRRLIKYIGDK